MEPTLLFIFAAAVTVMLVSLSGVLFTLRTLSIWTERNLKYLISFSAGVFLVVALHLSYETIEIAGTFPGTFFVLLGIMLFALLSYMLPEAHHHHEKEECEDTHTRAGAIRMIIGDAIHNVGDGVLLTSAFFIDVTLGVVTAIGIILHEILQEISEFFVLREAGYTVREALTRNFLASTTILVGVIAGYFLIATETFTGIVFGVAAGAFLYVIFKDLILKTLRYSRAEKRYAKYIASWIFGVLIALTLNTLAGHSELSEENNPSETNTLASHTAQPR
jgi:zinc and cadmium transporter